MEGYSVPVPGFVYSNAESGFNQAPLMMQRSFRGPTVAARRCNELISLVDLQPHTRGCSVKRTPEFEPFRPRSPSPSPSPDPTCSVRGSALEQLAPL